MQNVNSDIVSHLVVSHVLASLLKETRETMGLSIKQAANNAKWSTGTWEGLENEKIPIEPVHYKTGTSVLQVSEKEVVLYLDNFIAKHPNVWLEKMSNSEYKFCERPITSPKAMRSGNVVNVDLNQIRPSLFYELCAISPQPAEIMEHANAFDVFSARATDLPPHPGTPSATRDGSIEARRERLKNIIGELSEDKLGLLERVIDKFQRFAPRTLAYAYQHFTLAVKQ